ncbi:MAG: GspMb/PilO family protein [Chthoniobacterales bacterium]
MNSRERVLAMIVGGTVFLLLNVFLWSSLLGTLSRTRTELAERRTMRKQQSVFLQERPMWEKRAEWLKQKQPTLQSPQEASSLLDQVKQIAAKHNVLLESPQIGSGDSTPNYQAVFASVETKSPWPPLVHFLYDVQQPESFVVFESVNLAIDSADPTTMRGKFKIARWFAPK